MRLFVINVVHKANVREQIWMNNLFQRTPSRQYLLKLFIHVCSCSLVSFESDLKAMLCNMTYYDISCNVKYCVKWLRRTQRLLIIRINLIAVYKKLSSCSNFTCSSVKGLISRKNDTKIIRYKQNIGDILIRFPSLDSINNSRIFVTE